MQIRAQNRMDASPPPSARAVAAASVTPPPSARSVGATAAESAVAIAARASVLMLPPPGDVIQTSSLILCKPKLLPIKSAALQKLFAMERELRSLNAGSAGR